MKQGETRKLKPQPKTKSPSWQKRNAARSVLQKQYAAARARDYAINTAGMTEEEIAALKAAI